MRRSSTTTAVIAGLAVVAGLAMVANGWIHLRDWLETYRHLPGSVPGVAVVKIGFPVEAGLSFVLAVAVVAGAVAYRRALFPVTAVAVIFQIGALAGLILSRTGTVFGWSEPVWAGTAGQARFLEITTLVALAAMAAVAAAARRAQLRPMV